MSAEGGSGGARGAWDIRESVSSSRTNNPIRKVVDNIKIPEGADLIPLSLGDPTVFGNMKTPDVFVDALATNLRSYRYNGYIHAAGLPVARKAIAQRYSLPTKPLTENDVVIGSGCSGAIDLAINVLLNPGDNLLVPCPGFALYQTVAESRGIEVRHYNLDPARQWEVDLDHLDSLVDSNTRGIVVTNPSNPCGSVYSKAHLEAILAVADKHHVPIIADEIYGNLVFEGETFHPMASLTSTVPILAVGGIAKEFLVPGWRVGWVIVYDVDGLFEPIRKGLFKLSQLILTSCSLIQSALPTILTPEPGSSDELALKKFSEDTIGVLQEHARFTAEEVEKIDGLHVVVPQGAMYVMFGIDVERFPDIADDVAFSQMLLDEEAVFVMPGQCFGIRNYCRIVFCAPMPKLAEAYTRMAAFCDRHRA